MARIAESQAARARGRAAASVALVVLLNVFGQRRVAALALAGIALLLFLFKVSGLYDRDELRLVHSTLDEVPLLVQLTGLFALGLAILQSIVLAGSLSATRIAALWIASFGTIVCGRTGARGVAGRTSPFERCLVIGEAAQAGADPRQAGLQSGPRGGGGVGAARQRRCHRCRLGRAFPAIMRRVVRSSTCIASSSRRPRPIPGT